MAASPAWIEEIVLSIQGEGAEAGKPHLFLRLSGCPLRCNYCDTPESWHRSAEFQLHYPDGSEAVSNPISGVSLSQYLTDVCGRSGVTPGDVVLAITGGEPLVQSEFLTAWLPTWKGRVMLETAGLWPQRLAGLSNLVEMVSLDWKLASTLLPSEEQVAPAECLRELTARNCTHWVKVVLSDEVWENELDVALAEISKVSPNCQVFLQPLTPRPGSPATATAGFIQAALLRNRNLDLRLRVLPQLHPLLQVR